MSKSRTVGTLLSLLVIAGPAQAQSKSEHAATEAYSTHSSRTVEWNASQQSGVSWKQAEPAVGVRGYSIVLVTGDLRSNGSGLDDVPDVARKALADMKAFLPYKSYRLIDAAWIVAAPGKSATSRMGGPDGKVYSARLELSPYHKTNLIQVSLKLNEVLDSLAAKSEPSANPDAGSSTRGRASAMSLPTPVISADLSMKVGETVVVGTSRLNGDKALIALLTAVPAN